MDLATWFRKRKLENPAFTQKVMAKELGIPEHALSWLMTCKHVPSIEKALLIESYTQGKVKWSDLMYEIYKTKLSRELTKQQQVKQNENKHQQVS